MATDPKEREAADALERALKELSKAMLKCGGAKLSWMNVIEPLMGADECIRRVRMAILGES